MGCIQDRMNESCSLTIYPAHVGCGESVSIKCNASITRSPYPTEGRLLYTLHPSTRCAISICTSFPILSETSSGYIHACVFFNFFAASDRRGASWSSVFMYCPHPCRCPYPPDHDHNDHLDHHDHHLRSIPRAISPSNSIKACRPSRRSMFHQFYFWHVSDQQCARH